MNSNQRKYSGNKENKETSQSLSNLSNHIRNFGDSRAYLNRYQAHSKASGSRADQSKTTAVTKNPELDVMASNSDNLEQGLLRQGQYEQQPRKKRPRSRKKVVRALPVDVTFQHMQKRMLLRKIWGTYDSNRPWTMFWTFMTLLLIFGAAGASLSWSEFSFKLNIGELGFWGLVTIVTFAMLVYTLTRILVVFRWMLYWLLAAEALNIMMHREYNLFSKKTPTWLVVILLVVEFMTLAIYLLIHFAYPALLSSEFFRKHIGGIWWWEVRIIGPWTLTYTNESGNRHTCTYRGETNEQGLPHGYGHWMDDSYHGEILTGWWENGEPVGPFRSREFGSGYAFDKLMIGFLAATDDEFHIYKLLPTNERPPRCGVAGVECSVSGAFFSHLPNATPLFGPFELDIHSEVTSSLETRGSRQEIRTFESDVRMASIRECLFRLKYLSGAHPLTSVLVTASEDRGVNIAGHTFAGRKGERVERLVIDVVYPSFNKNNDKQEAEIRDGDGDENEEEEEFNDECKENPLDEDDDDDDDEATTGSQTPGLRSSMQFAGQDLQKLPSTLEKAFRLGDEVHETSSDVDSVDFDANTFSAFAMGESSNGRAPSPTDESEKERFLMNSSGNSLNSGPIPYGFDASTGHFQPVTNSSDMPHLRVRDWRSTFDGHAEALIYIPGFASSLKNDLERLGQFLAMGRIPPHIKPFVFKWPAGKVLTYLWAIDAAATSRTSDLFCMLLDGLRDSGIRDVHIMTHSLGVQPLMGAFANRTDGSRSEASMRFRLARDYASDVYNNGSVAMGASVNLDENEEDDSLLRARTITLLNPDYPLAAFVDHGFATIRRVCQHITVVGNAKDGALFWSETGNGLMQTLDHYCGVRCYPEHLLVPLRPEGEIPRMSSARDPDSCYPANCTCCFRKPEESLPARIQGQDRLFSKQRSVGKSIFSLFAPSDERLRIIQHSPSLFFTRAPNTSIRMGRTGPRRHKKKRKTLQRLPWLDLDAIDTTWMESNVHNLRHNYFNLNAVLVEDLHELIVSGRRASERSTLLHREGNIYSYLQAPSCVVNES